MNDIHGLDIFLYSKHIGTIVNVYGDRNIFSFSEGYIEDLNRSTLSLSFKGSEGNLLTNFKSTRTRLPPFFSNLLPEGALREYLALQAKVNTEREFYLLKILGADLPGAITVAPASEMGQIPSYEEELQLESHNDTSIMRFSLAGVQLKFSAIWEHGKRLTIPTEGVGGSWIVKLPSSIYPGVAENEFAMMALANRIGIDVPEIKLVPMQDIVGIPQGFSKVSGMAFAIKRFDRTIPGEKIHIEDFAQVFGLYPEKKYDSANYQNIAQVIWSEIGERGIVEFIRRLVFNALIGNGDMHLKNWSLIYNDTRNPSLAPAYDFVSTIPYIADDGLALNFVDSKKFRSLTKEQFLRFATKAGLPEQLVLDIALETVQNVKNSWEYVHALGLDSKTINTIENHMQTIPLFHS